MTLCFGWTNTLLEAHVLRDLCSVHGLTITIKRNVRTFVYKEDGYVSYSLWAKSDVDACRAREIKRGFKNGMKVRGDVFDYLLGVRAALTVRARKDLPRLRSASKKELK